MSGPNGTATETLQEALTRLVEEEWRPLLGKAWAFLDDLGDAEEAVQEALLKAAGGLPTLRDPASLRVWVGRTLVHECRNRRNRRAWERERRVPLPKDPDSDPDVELGEHGEDDERAWAAVPAIEESLPDDLSPFVRAEVARLPADLRAAVERIWLEERPLSEVAQEMGVPEATLWKRKERAFELLRPRLARLWRGIQA